MNILFIGAGKMATALAAGIASKQLFGGSSISACDPNADAAKAFTAATGYPCRDHIDCSAVANADVVILAVKPQNAADAAAALPTPREDALLFSICAGLSIARLNGLFGFRRIVRVMPNTPLMAGEGASCYALSDPEDMRAESFARELLGALGLCRKVEEQDLDAVTALSGSGPAYFFAFIEALRDGGVALGLDSGLATELAVQTMAGAVAMLRRPDADPAALRQAVTSKGGTTVAALEVMASHGFNEMVAELMAAAARRSRELGA